MLRQILTSGLNQKFCKAFGIVGGNEGSARRIGDALCLAGIPADGDGVDECVRYLPLEIGGGGTGVTLATIPSVGDQHDIDRFLRRTATGDLAGQLGNGARQCSCVVCLRSSNVAQQGAALAGSVTAAVQRLIALVKIYESELDFLGAGLDQLGEARSSDVYPIGQMRLIDQFLQLAQALLACRTHIEHPAQNTTQDLRHGIGIGIVEQLSEKHLGSAALLKLLDFILNGRIEREIEIHAPRCIEQKHDFGRAPPIRR
ncbi:MAG: hypothetical protein KDI56_03665, partial [Xanthomonadales bacterium]|nr:hypothetical protein [Xanthomonadales bacterium]